MALPAREIDAYGLRLKHDSRSRIDLPFLIDLYKAGKFKLDELITGRYPLDRINEAIDAVEKGEALRNVIVF